MGSWLALQSIPLLVNEYEHTCQNILLPGYCIPLKGRNLILQLMRGLAKSTYQRLLLSEPKTTSNSIKVQISLKGISLVPGGSRSPGHIICQIWRSRKNSIASFLISWAHYNMPRY